MIDIKTKKDFIKAMAKIADVIKVSVSLDSLGFFDIIFFYKNLIYHYPNFLNSKESLFEFLEKNFGKEIKETLHSLLLLEKSYFSLPGEVENWRKNKSLDS